MKHNVLTTPYYFADVYSCGAYGAGSFDGTDACTNVGTPDTGYAPNTVMGIGYDMLLIGGIAVVVLAAGIVTILRRRKKSAQ